MSPAPLRALVCGNVNVELALAAPRLPLPEAGSMEHPHGLTLGVSGVGFNVAHALARLGADVRFLGLVGDDAAGAVVRRALAGAGIGAHLVPVPATPLSLVLSGTGGGRQIHRDLKGTAGQAAPVNAFREMVEGHQAVVLGNVAWTRDLLPLARAAGVSVVTDLQGTPGPGHAYDAPYLAGADVVFLSGERLGVTAEAAVRAYRAEYDPEIIVVGLGAWGALLSERGPGAAPPARRPHAPGRQYERGRGRAAGGLHAGLLRRAGRAGGAAVRLHLRLVEVRGAGWGGGASEVGGVGGADGRGWRVGRSCHVAPLLSLTLAYERLMCKTTSPHQMSSSAPSPLRVTRRAAKQRTGERGDEPRSSFCSTLEPFLLPGSSSRSGVARGE